MNELEQYLQPTEFFNFNKRNVREKALEITEGLKTDKEKAIALFYWVRDKIKYNIMGFYMRKNNFKASITIRRMNGFCVSKAILLSTLARAVGIPAKLHIVDIINHLVPKRIVELMGTNVFYFHGYSELYLNGKWVKATPVFDKNTALKAGFLPMVEFDGENDGLLAPYDVNGNIFVEYVGDRGVYIDFPYDEIEIEFNKNYGNIINMIEKGFPRLKPFKKGTPESNLTI